MIRAAASTQALGGERHARASMLNYATQRYVSHVLLIDSESPGTMRTLAENALDLHAEFGAVSGVSPYGHYTLILAFPADRADLAALASDLKHEATELARVV